MKFSLQLSVLILLVSVQLSLGIEALKVKQPPIIDGILDDQAWSEASPYDQFFTYEPSIGAQGSERTICYSAYDSDNLYFAMRCYDNNPSMIKATLTKRDNIYEEDHAGVCIDAQNDQQNSYFFVSNPKGVQGDMLLDAGGDARDVSDDFVFTTAGRLTDYGYAVEFSIPLKSLRFRHGDTIQMGIAFIRKVIHNSESVISPEYVPGNGNWTSQYAKVTYEELSFNRIVEILPSITSAIRRDSLIGPSTIKDDETNFGITAKYSITPTLILDATYNPDFSQIESDAGQMDVNQRFAQFYSEKRPFFMEGRENYYCAAVNSYSSSIGSILHTRTVVDPIFGLKLSGKIGRNGQIASLFAIDEYPKILNRDSEENAYVGAVRYRHLLSGDDFMGAIFTNREYDGEYNRAIGVDYFKRLNGNTIIEADWVQSFNQVADSTWDSFNYDLVARYNDKYWFFKFVINDMGKDFKYDNGFVPRDGITAYGLNADRNIFISSKYLKRIRPNFYGFYQWDKYSSMAEGLAQLSMTFDLIQSSEFKMDVGYNSEIFVDSLFDKNFFKLSFGGQPNPSLYLFVNYRNSGAINYNPYDPYQGDVQSINIDLTWLPTNDIRVSLSGYRELFERRSDGSQQYDYRFYRGRTTYQVNKYLFVRAIAEYNAYHETYTTDFLASFTYIPGTVMHLGYGSFYEKQEWEEPSYVTSDKLHEMRRGLFFKASYNWRL